MAFLAALVQLLFFGNQEIFSIIMQAVFSQSKVAFEIALGLVGVMAFWLGILRLGEQCGFLGRVTALLEPLLVRLFPEVPRKHPAFGAMVMNLSANVLGLDNAATPLGLKAMRELQTLNPDSESASNAQTLFLVLNTSSVTLFPVTLFAYRAQQGATDPTDIFIPVLLATFASTLAGLLAVSWVQRIKLTDPVVLMYLAGIGSVMSAVLVYFAGLAQAEMQARSSLLSNFLLFGVIIAFLVGAARKNIPAFETFVDGAKEGFQVAITIIPYLVAMLGGIAVFRASGVMDLILEGIRIIVSMFGADTRFVDALPTAMMKPFSGSGARGLMIDAMQTHGADSFAGRLACVMQGSTETTFYVVALYFGSVGIRRTRHAIPCGLFADAVGLIAAIFVAYLFFG